MAGKKNRRYQQERNTAIQQAKILKALIGVQEVSIILNTFIKAFKKNSFIKKDNVYYLHGNFNLGGTVSGRLSCVAGWTEIVTKNGFKPIRYLTIKDEVWTHRHRFQPITQLVLKGLGDMYDVTFCNGEVLTCTTDHRVLLSTGQWQSIEEIINVGIENLDTKSRQHFERTRAVSKHSFNVYSGKSSRAFRFNFSQRIRSTLSKLIPRRIQNNQGSKIFGIKVRKQQPSLRKTERGMSQLDWRMRRWLWVSDHIAQWKTGICTSGRDDESSWTTKITRKLGCSSRRHKSNEQQHRQPSSLYKCRASNYPSLTGRGQSTVEIKEINYRGRYEVYDISVAQDESYLAAGIFSHNSNGPNLMNIPSNPEKPYAKLIKNCFISPPGWIFAGADFDSLEDKISALTTRDPNKLKCYTDGYDGHCLRAYSYFGSQMPDITKKIKKAKLPGKFYKITHDDGEIEYVHESDLPKKT